MGADGGSFQHGDCHAVCAKAFLHERQGKQRVSLRQPQHGLSSDNLIVVFRRTEKRSSDGGVVGFFLREEEGRPITI